jgi:cell division protein ZapA (FtsZ GTPase activity inhibitor)
MNEKVEVLIGTRRLTVIIEELTSLEINALAQRVSTRMAEMREQNNEVADTSKIALLVALSFAAEFEKEFRAHEMTKRMLENSAERCSQSLRESLDAGGPPVGP